MSGLAKTLVATLLSCGACAPAIVSVAYAAEAAPIGPWRATNDCLLAAFVLNAGGQAQTAYLTGEHDDNAAWTWDGSTLKITSPTFDLDTFSGHLKNDHIEADYVWHDLDKNELNRQACVFERFSPSERAAALPHARG